MSKELTKRQKEIALKWISSGWEEGYANVPDEEAICVIRYLHGCYEGYARFILDIERGVHDGEIVHDDGAIEII